MKGTYILVIKILTRSSVNIGALGELFFDKGYYLYVGSAMGEGSTSLINRLKRHLLPSTHKKIHWHIDYLLKDPNSSIITIYLIPSQVSLECIIAQEFQKKSDDIILNFGASDCDCQTHLFHFRKYASLEEIYTSEVK
jgi:Uri superfamily endonuclease